MNENQAILEKAIQKAVDGGWSKNRADGYRMQLPSIFSIPGVTDAVAKQIIFDHDFAKALWGTQKVRHHYHQIIKNGKKIGEAYGEIEAWMLRLEQMVIADDPIAYLGENI